MTSVEYPFTMHPLSEDEGGGYLIEFPDLPGCMSDGETPEEAIQNGADAVQCWIEAMREAGRPIPPPSRAAVSKRVIGVHDHVYQLLAEEANLQGLSVETIVHAALIEGFSTLLERIKTGPPRIEKPAKVR
jgi:antitoxin HicB